MLNSGSLPLTRKMFLSLHTWNWKLRKIFISSPRKIRFIIQFLFWRFLCLLRHLHGRYLTFKFSLVWRYVLFCPQWIPYLIIHLTVSDSQQRGSYQIKTIRKLFEIWIQTGLPEPPTAHFWHFRHRANSGSYSYTHNPTTLPLILLRSNQNTITFQITLGSRKNNIFYSRVGVGTGPKKRLRLHPQTPATANPEHTWRFSLPRRGNGHSSADQCSGHLAPVLDPRLT